MLERKNPEGTKKGTFMGGKEEMESSDIDVNNDK